MRSAPNPFFKIVENSFYRSIIRPSYPIFSKVIAWIQDSSQILFLISYKKFKVIPFSLRLKACSWLRSRKFSRYRKLCVYSINYVGHVADVNLSRQSHRFFHLLLWLELLSNIDGIIMICILLTFKSSLILFDRLSPRLLHICVGLMLEMKVFEWKNFSKRLMSLLMFIFKRFKGFKWNVGMRSLFNFYTLRNLKVTSVRRRILFFKKVT